MQQSTDHRGGGMKGSRSIYAPYYAKIQDLLFQGMPVKEVWLYMKIFFGIHAELNTLWYYINVSGLRWFIPMKKN